MLWTRYNSSTPKASLNNNLLSPALLSRARAVDSEHAELSKKVSEDFDARSAKRLGELSPIVNALREWEAANEASSELQSLLHDPSTDAELRALAADDLGLASTRFEDASHSLATSLIPPHPFVKLPCLLEIRPGAGGGEAALFASDLLRMYRAYCSQRGFRVSVLKYEGAEGASDGAGSDGPLQEAILEIDTPASYGVLRCEAGVHRVQRVPATESKGRTHTSAVSVMVLPSFPSETGDDDLGGEAGWNDPRSDYYIDVGEVRTDIMRARGAGGQHVNTTESAVRLTHIPTGTVVAIQDSRSQPKNKEKAWRLLRSRLAQQRREAREEEAVKLRRSVVGVARMGRGDKVRTYNWGQQRVTDHRSGISVHNLDDVLAGGDSLEKVMESVRAWLVDKEVEALVTEEAALPPTHTKHNKV
ncbi:MAG: hypothetical protein M1825_004956 [Sarcosagium campestre]|nr:MAG: hypothetical protein M1825_004956 [Sarcosagium campestre]